jgi:hypothetical protein
MPLQGNLSIERPLGSCCLAPSLANRSPSSRTIIGMDFVGIADNSDSITRRVGGAAVLNFSLRVEEWSMLRGFMDSLRTNSGTLLGRCARTRPSA